jgi:hypothetical protein
MEKTLAIHLQEQREKIVKEIESHMPHGSMCDITLALKQAIDIVQGIDK